MPKMSRKQGLGFLKTEPPHPRIKSPPFKDDLVPSSMFPVEKKPKVLSKGLQNFKSNQRYSCDTIFDIFHAKKNIISEQWPKS